MIASLGHIGIQRSVEALAEGFLSAAAEEQTGRLAETLVELLIKEINDRAKGTEQFWNRPEASQGEPILQVTACLLSDGELLTKHILITPRIPLLPPQPQHKGEPQ